MRPDETKSRGHGDKKPGKMHRFVVNMLSHPTIESAAAATNIGKATAMRWMRDPAVIAQFREARRDAMRHITARLQAIAGQSVETLAELQRSAESEAVRASTARAILELALRAVDAEDIQLRLDAIEQSIKSQGFTPGPRVSLTYEHEKNGKGSSHDGQNNKAPCSRTGDSRGQ
jgi:hypothetical protein